MWFFCKRANLKPPGQRSSTLDEHLAWMKEQHEAGRVLFSGPTVDRQYGIYVVRAASRQAAERIAASDPFTAAGMSTFELFEWEVHQILGVGPFTTAELEAQR
jgi:uncharacterized protein YciI